jgi:hypothetical protein
MFLTFWSVGQGTKGCQEPIFGGEIGKSAKKTLDNSQIALYTGATLEIYGDRSSIGRALDCGSSGCGFKPHRSPFFIFPLLIKSLFPFMFVCSHLRRSHLFYLSKNALSAFFDK